MTATGTTLEFKTIETGTEAKTSRRNSGSFESAGTIMFTLKSKSESSNIGMMGQGQSTKDPAQEYVEKSLILRAQQGEQHAFSRLIDIYRDRIVRLAHGMTGSMEDANDLCQETFVRAYRALHTFDRERPFKPWIYRIANNVILDHFRQKKVRPSVMEPDPERPFEEGLDSSAISPEMNMVSKETRDRVWSAIQSLPENYREVVVYRFVDDLSYADIAEALNLTETNVMMRMSRARKMLRERLSYLQAG